MAHKLNVVSVDAWREPDGGWTWNASYSSGHLIVSIDDVYKPRRLLAALRAQGHLGAGSPGKLHVEYYEGDPTLVEIQLRGTREPILGITLDWQRINETEGE